MAKLTIPGRLPGANEYIKECRANYHAAAKMKREVETDVGYCIMSQLRGKRFGAVKLRFSWYEDGKKRDKDNIAFAKKFILDALQKAGVIKGDGWNCVVGFSDEFYVDRENPRVEVEIIEVMEAVS